MKKHARRWNARPAPPRTGLLLGLALLLTAVLATACADLVSVSEEEAKPSASNQAAGQEVFMVEEDQPELIGGMEALYEKLEYPPMAREAGIQGRVFLQFVVDEEGRVTDPKILRSPHELLGEEALRVIRLMEFEPGTQQGEPVKVRLSIPITFRLQGEPPPPPTPAVQAERPDAALDVDEPLQQTPPPPPEPFMVVSDQPEMIGGMEALYDEIAYPAPARKAGIEGTVVVEFVVDEAGNVVSPTVVRGVHPALDAAALDAVRQVQFEPGRLEDGTPVQVKMALPIRFELSGGAGEAPGGTSSDA